METRVEYSYKAILELADGSKHVVWLTASSREEAKKEVKGSNIKYLYEQKAVITVERFEIE